MTAHCLSWRRFWRVLDPNLTRGLEQRRNCIGDALSARDQVSEVSSVDGN